MKQGLLIDPDTIQGLGREPNPCAKYDEAMRGPV